MDPVGGMESGFDGEVISAADAGVNFDDARCIGFRVVEGLDVEGALEGE